MPDQTEQDIIMDSSDDIVVEVHSCKGEVMSEDEPPESLDKTSTESAHTPPAAPQTAPSSSSAAAPALVPSLKGVLSYVGGLLTCKGKWAMSDADHANPLLTSDFEFHLVQALHGDGDGALPVDGRYQGWFFVKQAAPLKPLKVEDKDMEMRFVAQDEAFSIAGQGHNVYGKFNLRGTLSKDGAAHIYREYYFFNPPPPAVQRKLAVEAKRKANAVPSSSGASSAREGGARTRKPSAAMKEAHAEAPVTKRAPPAVEMAQRPGERSHRLNPALRRCAELLKEIAKMPQAVWFLEPVDPVKFNIPEYPKIIKHPMDFSTIKHNLDGNIYEAPEDFAAHVRLVFKNAVTFNTDRESLVHIAAKDLGARFEDKFSALLTQLAPELSLDAEPAARGKGSSSAKSRTPGTSVKAARESAFSDRERRRSAPGPRPQAQTAFIPPAAVDQGTLLIMEMQKKMESMEAELGRLRATVRENALKDRVEESVEAAKNPLTLDEKRALVTQIQKLPPEKMERALDIIREAISTTADDGEIEIPIDSLDTLTLRRLQKFTQDHIEKKKRPGPGASKEPSSKKQKKPTKQGAVPQSLLPSDDNDLALFDDHEPLLFENDQLDSTPLQPVSTGLNAGPISFADSFPDDEDEDDDNKWGDEDPQSML